MTKLEIIGKSKKYYKDNKIHIDNRNKKYYYANIESERNRRKKYYNTNKEKSRIYYDNNIGRIREYRKKAYHKNNGKRLLETYGITLEQYDILLQSQNFSCVICSGLDGKRKLSVDHDHLTKRVRGLLCFRCNSILGLSKDKIDILKMAIIYLEKQKEKS